MTDEKRAAIMINRVHGFGKIRALALCVGEFCKCADADDCRAEAGARSLDDLLKSEDKEYGRKIAAAQKVCLTKILPRKR